ncbi:hypothetical protein LZ554_007651 [Drepanopeziza brunnea f. sp. 'monogermtubi']|nr:hypothetical protein LZ554_007651 [Drepanopeziza brunnea f. sp. 'monogermtubi']
MSDISLFLADILGDMIFLPLMKGLCWVVPSAPTILGYLLFNVIFAIFGMSAVMVLAYFFFPAAVDDRADLMRDVFWLRGLETWERFKRSAHAIARHLLVSGCVHLERGCDCFRNHMPLAELERLIDEAPAREFERELEDALATINDTRIANTILTAERDEWERRARDAEDQRRVCILEHQNYGRYQEANAHYRQRNAELVREMADLRRRYNRERNRRGLGPMFDEQPGNLAEVNADLQRQIGGLHDQLSRAGLRRGSMSGAERTNARRQIDGLEHRITRYVQQIEELEMRVAEFERGRSLTDDEEKASLRQRLTDVRNELRVVNSDRVEEELRRRKAEEELARLRDSVEAGGGDVGSDPPRRCSRCNTFRKDRNEQREIVTELRAQLAAAAQKAIDDAAILRMAVERLRGASRDVDRLPGSEESGSAPPQDSNAVANLALITAELKKTMVEFHAADAGIEYDTTQVLRYIAEAPRYIGTVDAEARNNRQVAEEAIQAARQQVAKFEDEVRNYTELVLDARRKLNPDTALPEKYNVGDYIRETLIEWEKWRRLAREAKQHLDPTTAVMATGYGVEDYIRESVEASNLQRNYIEQMRAFDGQPPDKQRKRLWELQGENESLSVRLRDGEAIASKTKTELERLRLQSQTYMVQTRSEEDKRRHAVFDNLKNVVIECIEHVEVYRKEFENIDIPDWVTTDDSWSQSYDFNILPTMDDMKLLASKLSRLVAWMEEENWPGVRPGWKYVAQEGIEPDKNDEVGVWLQKMMVKVRSALFEVALHEKEHREDPPGARRGTGCPRCSPLSPRSGSAPPGGDKGSPRTGREGIQLKRGRRKKAPEPTVTKGKDSMAPGSTRTYRSPSVASATESEKSFGTSPVLSENPIFWRIADTNCMEMFRRIEGYQKGLIKHGIDVSKYQQGGKNLESMTVETIDNLRPSEAEAALTESPILKKQSDTLRAQLQALEAMWVAGQREHGWAMAEFAI